MAGTSGGTADRTAGDPENSLAEAKLIITLDTIDMKVTHAPDRPEQAAGLKRTCLQVAGKRFFENMWVRKSCNVTVGAILCAAGRLSWHGKGS